MTLKEFNSLTREQAAKELEKCCGSKSWLGHMINRFPFENRETMLKDSEEASKKMLAEDWKEAFTHHPRIGDMASLEKKFGSTAVWASGEQAAVQHTSREVLQALAAGNEAYEKKFGYLFIVCATGKSAEEMLTMLEARLPNDPANEIWTAASEQNKITALRLQKLIE
jgi:2-oxo-4-hydroxy-4-carboxy-5-ureidoimidazoline decarboxylase